jgi:hypothetical protein
MKLGKRKRTYTAAEGGHASRAASCRGEPTPHEGEGVSSAPDYCEPIVGWRVWHALERNGDVYLRSLFHRVRWPWREPLNGSCAVWHWPLLRKRPQHASPDENCQCGIYASSLETAAAYVSPPRGGPWLIPTEWSVIGEVALWGRIVEHTHGWRAAFAYPKALFVLANTRTRAQRREASHVTKQLEHYGVPVELLHSANADSVVAALSSVEPVGNGHR